MHRLLIRPSNHVTLLLLNGLSVGYVEGANNKLNKPHNSVITYILCYVYVKFNTMDRDDEIEITVKVIFLIGIIWFLVHISNGKNITYKSKGVYEISR